MSYWVPSGGDLISVAFVRGPRSLWVVGGMCCGGGGKGCLWALSLLDGKGDWPFAHLSPPWGLVGVVWTIGACLVADLAFFYVLGAYGVLGAWGVWFRTYWAPETRRRSLYICEWRGPVCFVSV